MIARRSNCGLCGYLCGLVAHVSESGALLKLDPDPSQYPYDVRVTQGCRRFDSNMEILDHPARMNYPLKRVGERGSGKWRRVTWDEALSDISLKLDSLKAHYGAETLATSIAAPHNLYWPLHRFLNLFGSPNNIGIGTICWNPAIWVHSLTYGWPIEAELDPRLTRCAILWGVNPAASDNSLLWRSIKEYGESGGRLIVIDPRRTKTAAMADIWLPVRPGSDGALALAMINVIIEEGLYDHHFVDAWCSGFELLRRRVSAYPPDKVADTTGIQGATIAEAARAFATLKPASIMSGLGIDQSGHNCTQALRSLAILRAITGNLDRRGACHLSEMPDFIPETRLEMSEVLPLEQRDKKLGRELFRLPTYDGFERLSQFTQLQGKRLPARYLTSTHPYLAWGAMVTGRPYPIRALVVMASNPLLSQADTRLVYEALKSLDILIVLEQFMTPTAMLADYVLPAAGSLEQPMLQTNAGVANIAYGGAAALSPLYERRPDFFFWRDLGRLSGQEQYWPWETIEEAMDDVFAPVGLTWRQFCETGLYCPEHVYRKHEAHGFATPSGKVELCSSLLEEVGCDPLPAYIPPDDEPSDYPLRLVTGVRWQPYISSEFRQVESLRSARPEPRAEMNAATAARLGLDEGDLVWIETSQGRIQQTLRLSEMLADVVTVEYGWWYPEQPSEEPSLGGLWQSNANLLTSADVKDCDPVLGQWSYRTLHCRVYRVAGAKSDCSA